MNVLLIYPNTRGDNLIPLGLSLVSASLKNAGHNVKLFDTSYVDVGYRTGDELREEKLQVRKTDRGKFGLKRERVDTIAELKIIITEFNPKVIGLSVLEIDCRFGLDILKKAKEFSSDSYTIVGGIYATMSPETVIENEFVDAVCIGEGEDACVDYCNAIEENKNITNIKNLWVKKNAEVYKNPLRQLKSLDELPFQDWEIFEKRHLYKPMGGEIYRMCAIEFSRGCYFNCTFCCNSKFHGLYKGYGKYHREKSVSRLKEEIQHFKNKYGIEYVYFNDESFLSMREERFDEFVEMWKQFKLPFFIESRAEFITEKRVQKLKELGCEGIAIGIESGNDYIRKKVLGRNMSRKTIIKAFEVTKKYKIRSSANNIIGLPYETRKQIFDTIKLNRCIKTDSICVNAFSPYNGSKLRDICIKEGYIPKDFIADDYRTDNFMKMPQISIRELKSLQMTFPLYVSFPKIIWPIIRIAEQNDTVFKILSRMFIKMKWET